MKIGIITYHRPHNYGALLQAFSLKKYLNQKGYNSEIIDYWPSYHSNIYKIFYNFSKLSKLSKIKKVIFVFFDFYRILKRQNGYLKFCQKYLNLHRKPKFNNPTLLSKLDYDVVIYGSDQIWRKQNLPQYEGFDDVYFGENISSKRKIAYAASMGIIDLNKQDEMFIKEKLANFDSVSVREAGLMNAVSNLTKQDVKLVLDPVFLLGKNDWQNIIPKKKIKEKYVFFFRLISDEDSVAVANKIAGFIGCEVIEIPGTIVNTKLWGKRYIQTASPLEFLSLIYNAEFVVSSSFHCIAFSLIFEKQFYAIGLNKNSDRVKTLLETLKIGNRYLNNADELVFENNIDYVNVSKLLKQQIENSCVYLNDALTADCI